MSVAGASRTYTSSTLLALSGSAAASTVNPILPPTRHGSGPGPSGGRSAWAASATCAENSPANTGNIKRAPRRRRVALVFTRAGPPGAARSEQEADREAMGAAQVLHIGVSV